LGHSQEALLWLNRLIDQLETLTRTETRFERRQKAAPPLALAYYTRGMLLVDLGKPEESRAEFERALGVKDANLPPEIAAQCRAFRLISPAILKDRPKKSP
jgi:hypothetical protein